MNAEDRYDSLFQFYGGQMGVPWLLLKAQVRAESNFNPDAKSAVGALGLAQFMRRTWVEISQKNHSFPFTIPDLVLMDPTNPEVAIGNQAYMMAGLLKNFPSVELALAAYNWGYGHVSGLRENSNASWDMIAHNTPEETQHYVERIIMYYNCYQQKELAKS
jgi:soluble lytic murein transglycosylase-like protein